MKSEIRSFSVQQLINALQDAARYVREGLDAPVRLLDWEMNHENIRTLQVCCTGSEVLIRFEPNESNRSPSVQAVLEEIKSANWER